MEYQSYSSEILIKLMRGDLTAKLAFHSLSRWFGYQFPDDIEIDYSYIFQNIAVELFADSNPENQEKGKGEPLGLLAERITISLLQLEYPGFGTERVVFGSLGIEP